ncbi:MAG: helix-turn-helix domain-containing protein [Acidobacteriota bacterium]
MSTSPAQATSAAIATDVFERLARCDRLLTAKELAQILAMSPKTLYSYVGRGIIPFFKIESNVRFRPRDVSDWLRRRSGRASV